MKKYPYSFGLIPDEKDRRDYLFRSPTRVKVGTGVDWTPYLSPVKDQKNRGACVSFAMCAAMEFLCKDDGDNLSEEMLYRIIASPGGGSSPRNACKILQKLGTCRERFWPYDFKAKDPVKTRYVVDWIEHRRALGDARKFRIDAYRKVGIDDLTSALKEAPIPMGLKWYESWFETGHIKIKPRDRVAGLHMVCLCGYTNINGVINFKFKNSWSERWGAKGYGYINLETLRKVFLDSYFLTI